MQKTSENDVLRLQHMLDAAYKALQFAEGKSRSALDDDFLFQYALARAVEIVCEAACNITVECQTQSPQIDWKRIMGMRQWLAHAYFELDLDILWKTTEEDLPPLIAHLEAILSDDEPRKG